MNSCQLQSVKIANFKSYKSLVEIRDFHQFTAVIGPNGSGKSNFMDAIGFGLGGKYMDFRVNNLSELFHGGSAQRSESNSCYVELSFGLENEGGKKFKRTLFANSRRNQYEVNSSIVSSDVYQEELNRLGICNFGKSCLVVQGDIESIAVQDPKERCRYFERICGSENLKNEYILAKRETEEANSKVQSIFEKMKVLDLEVKILSTETKEAEVFGNLLKKERNLERNQYLFNLFHIEEEIKKINDNVQAKSDDLKKTENDQLGAKRDMDDMNESINIGKAEMSQLRKEMETKDVLLEEKKLVFIGLGEEIKLLKKRKDEALKSLACDENNLEIQKRNILDLKESKELIESGLENLKQLVSSSPQFLDELQFQEYNRLKVEATKQTALYSQKIDPELRELQKYQDKLENETRRKKEISANIESLTKNHERIEDRIIKLQQSLETTRNSITEQEKFRDDFQQQMNDDRRIFNELQINMESVTKELKNTIYAKECSEKYKRKAETMQILKAEFPDVIGRLSDLCRPINSRYKAAFAKIFNKHADAIVVKTTGTALKCIKFLQVNKIHKETFIPLEDIKVPRINERLRTIKGAKLAYDVVNFQPEIRQAVGFVADNILVCENIEIAKKLSSSYEVERGRKLGNTCVSLDGTMFSKYGTISGGSFGLDMVIEKWDNQKIQSLRLKKQTLKEELNAISQKLREHYKLESLNSKIDGLKKSEKFMKDHLDSVAKEKLELETKVNDLRSREEEIVNEIEEIKEKICEKNEEISGVKERMSNVEDSIFENFCLEIGFTNIREYENSDVNFQKNCEKIQELRAQLNRINTQLEYEESRDFEREISKLREIVTKKQTRLEQKFEEERIAKEEVNKLEGEFQEERNNLQIKSNDVQEALKVFQEFHKLFRKKAQEVEKINQDLKEIKEEISILRNKMKEILRTCRSHEIELPLVSGNLENYLDSEEAENEDFVEVDYSDLPDDYKTHANKLKIVEDLARQILQVRETLERLRAPNQRAAERLKALKQQSNVMKRKLKEEKGKAKAAVNAFEDVKARRTEIFQSFLDKISNVIDNIYKELTNNTSAQALLVAQNPEEPYLSGIVFSCVVPGKRVLVMEGLSGGEKTLSAFALILAIQKANSSPFLLLDEVDAALDPTNVKKLTSYIKREKEFVQFIVVSLKLKFSSEADSLIGVTTGVERDLRSCIFTFDLQKYV